MDEQFLIKNLARINISTSQIQFAFLVGSRAWGTSTKQSDYDVIIILKQQSTNNLSSMHTPQFDFKIMDVFTFEEQIESGSFLEIFGLFAPQRLIYCLSNNADRWMDEMRQRINFVKMEQWITNRQERDIMKADKFAQKKQYIFAVKALCHAMRTAYLAARIRDVAAAAKKVVGDLRSEADALVEKQVVNDRDWEQFRANVLGNLANCYN
ncbi:hypothetical protein HK100_006506 [Physocladia obscura]|uniref:Polymerase beta nucleotidyltransferase domain-containing protein n=1 Tax=Physocladia obscura TaxID=109957 RepID=A0AAD5SSE8_9FUNG|nr:hypothetical protein HK100_006506 [Physocladia obscura]